MLNVCCDRGLSDEESIKLLLILEISGEVCRNARRTHNEPNEDFAGAKCVDRTFANPLSTSCSFNHVTIYPSTDRDFFLVSIQSGSFRLYFHPEIDRTIQATRRVGFQIFDANQNLIFDPEDSKFHAVSATLIENRFLTKEDCPSRCREE